MASVRYTSEFEAETGETYLIQIWDQEGGSGSEFDSAPGGFQIRLNGEGDGVMAPILGTECTVQLFAKSGTEDAIIPDLISSEEGRFLIRVLRNGVQEWVGQVLPDVGSYEEAPYPYMINLRATDGLGSLKDKKYWDETAEEPFTGKQSAIGHICRALRKIGHVGTFFDNDDFFVRSAVDWWEERMTNDPEGGDALLHTHIDHSVWYKWEKGQRDYVTCFEVLKNIMTKFGARLTMYQGAFWIEQRTYRTAATVVLRRYNKLGTLESTVNFSGITTVDMTEGGALLKGANYEFYPALLDHTHTFFAKTRRNFLDGLKTQTFANQVAETMNRPIEQNGGKTSLRFTGNIRVSISSKTYNAMGANPLKPFAMVFRLYVKLSTVGICRDMTLTPSYQVQYGQPYWGNPPVLPIVFPVLGSTITANLTGDTYTFTQTVDLYSAKLTESTDSFIFGLALWEIKKFEGGGYPLNDFNIDYELLNPWLEAYSEGGPVVGADEIEYTCKNTLYPKNSVSTKTDALIGTSNDPNTLGALWVKPGFTYLLADKWGDGEDAADGEIEDLLCNFTVSAQQVPLRKLPGTIFSNNLRALFKLDWLGVEWLLVGGTWSASNNEFTGEWSEMKYGSGLDTSPPKKKTNPVTAAGLPPHGNQGNNGGGEKYGLTERPPGTLFYPVAMTATSDEYSTGAVTSIGVAGTLAQGNIYDGDTLVIMNPITGNWDELEVTADSVDGDTAIAVTGTLTGNYPLNSPLIKKPKIGRFDLVDALDKFPEYDSDESAIDGGLSVGKWYVTSDGHLSAPSGILKKVRAV